MGELIQYECFNLGSRPSIILCSPTFHSSNIYCVLCARPVLGSGDTAMNRKNKNPYPLGANIRVEELNKWNNTLSGMWKGDTYYGEK